MTTKVSIGNIHITAYPDFCPPPFDPTIFFDDTTLTDWNPYSSEYLNEPGLFQTNFVAWLLQWKDQNILIDNSLSRFKIIFAAAGHPSCVFKITYNELIKITKGIVKEISE